METTKTKSRILMASLLAVVLLSIASRVAYASPVYVFNQQFSVPIQAYNTATVPQGYLFGTGLFSGSIDTVAMYMKFSVTLDGGTPNTQYIVKVAFYDATGGVITRAYGLFTTDSNGNAKDTEKTQIFAGTVQFALGLLDKTNFSPPLLVMVSDPEIGGDTAS